MLKRFTDPKKKLMRYRFSLSFARLLSVTALLTTAMTATLAMAQYRQAPVISPAPVVVINPSVLEALRYVTTNNNAPIPEQQPVVMYPPVDHARQAHDMAEYDSYGAHIIPVEPPKAITQPKEKGFFGELFGKETAQAEYAPLWHNPEEPPVPENFYQPMQEPPPTLEAWNLAQDDAPAPITRPDEKPVKRVEVAPILRDTPVETAKVEKVTAKKDLLGTRSSLDDAPASGEFASSEAIKSDATEKTAPAKDTASPEKEAPRFGETEGFTPRPIARTDTPPKKPDTLQLLDTLLAEKKSTPTPKKTIAPKPTTTAKVKKEEAPEAPVVAASPAPSKPTPKEDTFRVAFEAKETALPHDVKNRLSQIAETLSGDKDTFSIIGYAAPPGESNSGEARRISLLRALAVRNFLISRGVEDDRLKVKALGTPSAQKEILTPNRVDIQRESDQTS